MGNILLQPFVGHHPGNLQLQRVQLAVESGKQPIETGDGTVEGIGWQGID